MRVYFITLSVALLTLVMPEIWRDTFDWLRQSLYWRWIQIACLIWIVIVICVAIPWDGIFRWAAMNRVFGFLISAGIGVVIFGGGFLALTKRPGLTSAPVFSMSVVHFNHDATSHELVADLQFVNNGPIRRTVTNVLFTLRTPAMKPNEWQVLGARGSDLHGFQKLTAVDPLTPLPMTYRQKIEDKLVMVAGNILGLQIHTIDNSGEENFTNVDVMHLTSEPSLGNAVGKTTKRVKQLSLDEPWHSGITSPEPAVTPPAVVASVPSLSAVNADGAKLPGRETSEPKAKVVKSGVQNAEIYSLFSKGDTSLKVSRALEPYVGTVMTIEGKVIQVHGGSGGGNVVLSMRVNSGPGAICVFDAEWVDHLDALQRDQQIKVRGKIGPSPAGNDLQLIECELLEGRPADPSPTVQEPHPTPATISERRPVKKVTAREIHSEMARTAPLDLKEVGESFVGFAVDWILMFSSVHGTRGDEVIHVNFAPDDGFPPIIACTQIPQKGNEYLGNIKPPARFRVRGVIGQVQENIILLKEVTVEQIPNPTSTPAATATPQAKVIGNVTPRYLFALLENLTPLQRAKAIAPFKGQWTEAEGKLTGPASPHGDGCAGTLYLDPEGRQHVECRFGQRWCDEVDRLQTHAVFKVRGKIETHNGQTLALSECELMSPTPP